MAIGIDADTEYARRSGIPSGGAGTLSGGGFTSCFTGVWVYRPSATATYALTAGGSFIHYAASAREVLLGFNSAGSTLADLSLQIVFNSGGGADTPGFFSGHAGDDFLDEWVYYFIYDADTGAFHEQVAGYLTLADPSTVVYLARENDNAGSQYVNTLTFGNNSDGNACVLGHYAYARAFAGDILSPSDVTAIAMSDAPGGSDWGFWPLADNTDTGDDSGNGRTLTFSSGLTSQASPDLSPGISATAADTSTPSDSAVATSSLVAAASDTATPTDSVVAITSRVSAASDTSTPSDSATAIGSLVAAATDTSTPSDSAVASASAAITTTASDTSTPTDSAAATSSLGAAATDTSTPTDSAAAAASLAASASDTRAPTDSATAAASLASAASDSVTPTDSAASVAQLSASAADSASFGDTAAASQDGESLAVDSIALSDSAAAAASLAAAASDTSAPSDSAVALGSLAASAADVFSATDSAAATTDRVSAASDSVTPSDDAVASVLDSGSVAEDSLAPSDSAAALLDAISGAVDSLALSDRAVAARPAGPGGGRAWLRTWLQQKYGADFEIYAKERRERELKELTERAALTMPVPAAVQRAQERAAAGPAPRPLVDRRADLRRLLATPRPKGAVSVVMPLLPAVEKIQLGAVAKPAQRSADLAPDEEAMILEIARALNL